MPRLNRQQKILPQIIKKFSADDVLTLSAALAFYLVLALAPLILLLLTITSVIGPSAQQTVLRQVESILGPTGRQIASSVIGNSMAGTESTIAIIITAVILVFSASGVLLQLQSSINKIWEVQESEEDAEGWLAKRIYSVLVLVILLILSIGSIIAAGIVRQNFQLGFSANLLQLAASFVIFSIIFAVLFRIVPDVEVKWKDSWVGGIVTAALIALGQFAIGVYLSHVSTGSAYGSAGSLVVLLIWIYYSTIVFFLGAEFTYAYAQKYGSGVRIMRRY